MMEMFHVDRDEMRNLCKGGDVSCGSANQTQELSNTKSRIYIEGPTDIIAAKFGALLTCGRSWGLKSDRFKPRTIKLAFAAYPLNIVLKAGWLGFRIM